MSEDKISDLISGINTALGDEVTLALGLQATPVGLVPALLEDCRATIASLREERDEARRGWDQAFKLGVVHQDARYAAEAESASLLERVRVLEEALALKNWTPPFQVGDKVRRSNGEEGSVEGLDEHGLRIVFTHHRGSYDAVFDQLWFDMHPNELSRVNEQLGAET